MKNRFTNQEVEFILKNYPSNGIQYCVDVLNKPFKKIKNKISKLRKSHGLKLTPELYKKSISNGHPPKKNEQYAVNPNNFLEIKKKEVSYLLGLIWADGYVYKGKNQNKIEVSMVSEDLEKIKDIFYDTGKWISYYRYRGNNRKPIMCISTTNKILCSFLIENDYVSKGTSSADKIISKIPSDLKHYWFRGIVDGDGCFYINKKNKCYQFSIASSFEQDWTFVENIFKELNINYSIKRRTQLRNNKINKSSVIRITNKNDIIKFGNYIYNGYSQDKMGLNRKYEKYLEINDAQLI